MYPISRSNTKIWQLTAYQVLLLGTWFKSTNVESTQTTIQVSAPCEDGKYLDVSGLQCFECGDNEVVSGTGLECECSPGFIKLVSPPSDRDSALSPSAGGDGYTQCQSCLALGLVPSLSKSTCMACNASYDAVLNEGAVECECPDGSFALVELDATGVRLAGGKRCVQCPSLAQGHSHDTWRDPQDPSKCLECPRINSTIDIFLEYDPVEKLCKCPPSLPDNVVCTANSQRTSYLETKFNINLDSLDDVVFYNPGNGRASQTLSSALASSWLVDAAWGCSHQGDRAACNRLANLCVLQNYEVDSSSCKLYSALLEERKDLPQYHSDEVQPELDWMYSLPWLLYNDAPASFTARTDLLTQVSFNTQQYAAASVSDLVFVLSAYHLNGTWLGLYNLTTQFQLCGGIHENLGKWLRFGTNFENSCSLSVTAVQLWGAVAGRVGRELVGENPEALLFDLYLQDLGGRFTRSFPDSLYPVPILNKSLRQKGVAVNADTEGVSNDVLVRRFFFYDLKSAVETPGEPSLGFRAATTFDLTVSVRDDANSRIFPPLLTLQYTDRILSAVTEQSELLKVQFKVLYSMDLSEFNSSWTILTVVAMVSAGIAWFFRMYCFARRRQNGTLDFEAMRYGVFQACGTVGVACFLQCASIAAYWFVFYKGQDAVYTMIPEDHRIGGFYMILRVACIFQVVYVCFVVHRQVNYDIFFIDWEKARQGPSQGMTSKHYHPISVWRTLFVCNEWNELQVQRITSQEFTLITLMLFLYGLQLKGLANFTPNSSDLEDSPFTNQSQVLRFALATFLFLAIILAQVLFKVFIYHRYIEHPLGQFADLLSITNISILLLQDKYAGYYIHGFSQLPNADTNMIELIAQLTKEQEASSAVAPRGLVSRGQTQELQDNQCFEIYIDRDLRQKYDSTLMSCLNSTKRQMEAQSTALLSSMKKPNLAPGNTVEAQEEIAEVFREFIRKIMANHSQYIREKIFSEKLLSLPPDMTMCQNSVFYHDLQNRFGQYMFYGIEFDLAIFDILIFCVVDLAVTNFAIAAFCCYGVAYVLKYYRHQMGENNISEKTLVDGRFLI